MILKTELFPHQREAFDKLKSLKIGALFMEMGTGKTRTALELIRHRMDMGRIDYVIWLCPCAIKSDLLENIREHSNLDSIGALTICGIETLSTSTKWMQRLVNIAASRAVYLIVDESSKIKNPNALRSVHITQLAARCPYRLILNGTPISRNEADLFSQWYLLDWRVLGYRSYYSFAANHLQYDKQTKRVTKTLNVDYLARKIAPYTYQCLKADVTTLPAKRNFCKSIFLTEEQQMHYDEIADSLLMQVDEIKPETIYRLLSSLQAIVSGYRIKVGTRIRRSRFFDTPTQNPRTAALIETANELRSEQAVIFCTYVDEIIELSRLIPNSASFYGNTAQNVRTRTVDAFKAGNVQFLIASKGCGSYGLNLQHCHNLIYCSHDWDWATRAQSEDRVHRIGQASEVHITDIVARNTIDEQILRCLDRKENLSNSFKQKVHVRSKEQLLEYLHGGTADG